MQTRVFILLCGLSILMWWSPLVVTLKLALGIDAYTHLLLILPLSIALIYSGQKYRELRMQPFAPQMSMAVGSPLLALSVVILCTARWILEGGASNHLTLAIFGLVVWWIGSFIFCFGATTFESFAFPLCFLFLLVPLPQSAVAWIVEFLQQQSASAARIMFQLALVPVIQDGITLSIPGLDIKVDPECSSIRTSELLVVTTIVLAQLFLRSWRNKTLLVAAALPLAIAKNGFRIFTIALLGTRVDPGFLDGRLHRQGGILFYGLAVIVTMGLLVLLRRTERHAERSDYQGKTQLEVDMH